MVRKRYWGEKRSKRQYEEKMRKKRKKIRKKKRGTGAKRKKKESNAKTNIGEKIKGKSADGGDKTEKMNGWAEGRQRKGKAE